MKIVCDADKCCGCEACVNICAVNAITMAADDEGFKYPKIDDGSCINCGRCAAICPVNHPNYQNSKNPQCFAVMAEDDIRAVSASGGAFSVFADYILKQGGVVCGACYDKDWSVKHIIVERQEDLALLRGSKYVQSAINGIYKQIRDFCKHGRLVLFSGTPCQVAGLKSFLGKDYDNLFCLDLICHGVPSAKVLQKSLAEYAHGAQIHKLNMRDKTQGWGSGYWLNIDNEVIAGASFPFIKAFSRDLCLRKSCGNCPFARLPRQGDITIGDFWGVDKYNSDYNDKKGTSVAVVNNSHGADLLERVRNNFKLCNEVPLEKVYLRNYNLVRSSRHSEHRDSFFARLDEMTVAKNVKWCTGGGFDVGILNFWAYSNYGAIMTGFALQKALQEVGFSNKLILYMNNAMRRHELQIFLTSHFKQFADKYIDYTKSYEYADLQKLNKLTNNFIVGSDQVWRPLLQGEHKDVYYLSFASSDARKIACAASFGFEEYTGTDEQRDEAIFYLKHFDAVSVREYDGQDILNRWGIDSEVLSDPVFFPDRSIYDKIIDEYDFKVDEKFIFVYQIKESEFDQKVIDYYKETLNLPVIVADYHSMPTEIWLYCLKNAEMVITNSYHGVCFSLIFNKNFICTADKKQVYSRFKTLLNRFDLWDRIKSSADIVAEGGYMPKDIDYEKVNRKIAEESLRGKKWLLEALVKPKNVEIPVQEKMLRILAVKNSCLKDKFLSKDCYNDISEELEMLRDAIKYRKYKRRYYKYKLLAAITFGKLRALYRDKRREYRAKVKKIRSFLKSSHL